MESVPAASLAIEADVLAARRGDQQAFTRLVAESCTLVSSIALAIVRDPDLSRDIAQDVFLSAWRDIGKLREPASFLPWLRQVTRHRAYHILRGVRRRRRRTAETSVDELLAAAVDPRPDAHQRLASIETRQIVADTIDRLPADAREVVTLYYCENRSATQVAGLLGLSEAAVRQRLSRARVRLREDLLDRAGEEFSACAPGPAFVASVAHALTATAATAPAAATAVTTSAKTGGLLAKLAAAMFAVGVGMAGGLSGVMLSFGLLRRGARSQAERNGLVRLQRVAVALVVIFAIAMAVAPRLNRWAPYVVLGFYLASLVVIYEVWLPQVIKPRLEAEFRADPAGALRRRRRDRIVRAIAWSLATVIGMTAVTLGLHFMRSR
jgi:RNA polymerase sigma factor (sigma-70 family)